MITKLMPRGNSLPVIKKIVEGKDVSHRGAFELGTKMTFIAEVPRELGASAVVLRTKNDDNGREWDIPLCFLSTENGSDTYTCEIDLGEWCGGDVSGLFFYEFL